MPQRIRQYTIPFTTPIGSVRDRVRYYNRSNWVINPVTRRPDLRVQNEHAYQKSAVETWHTTVSRVGNYAFLPPDATRSSTVPPDWSWTRLDNEALARFNGKLRKGGASLGITIATYKQSREMIVNRCAQISKRIDYTIKALQQRRNKGRLHWLRKQREPLAGQVLEGYFGWAPLMADIHAVTSTVIQQAIPLTWVRAQARTSISQMNKYRGPADNPWTSEVWEGKAYVTLASSVYVENPNLWLLNRLGLINPATVAWDLVPFSFVVNMFVNVNQIISSITDEVGLTISHRSTTRTMEFTHHTVLEPRPNLYPDPSTKPGMAFSKIRHKTKQRTPGTFPSVKVQFKLPQANWDLAAIATSLLVQKSKTLNRLIRI